MGEIEEKIKKDRSGIIPGLLGWAKKYWLLFLILILVAGPPSVYVGVWFMDRPWFCALMCHNMSPHWETFKASRHGQALDGNMTCMDCHCNQGTLNHLIEHVVASKLIIPNVTKSYLGDHNNLHANVPGFDAQELDYTDKNASEVNHITAKCQERCHTTRIGKSFFMPVGEHGRHFIQDNCVRCHGLLMEQAAHNKEEGKKLLHEPNAPNPWAYPAPSPIANVHPLHLGLHIHCIDCHSRVVHSTEALRGEKHTPRMERCFRCHDGTKAPQDNCASCHTNPRNMFAGVDAKGIEETPSIMVEVSCNECHMDDDNFKASIEACIDCHDEDIPSSIEEWRTAWEHSYHIAKENYKKAKLKVSKQIKAGRATSAITNIFKKAEYNFLFAERDPSRGIHNPDFVEELFSSSNNGFLECLEMMKR